jgi:hypothetical protein
MARFVLGLAFGLVLGAAGTAAAASLTGDSSFLMGWDVLKGEKPVCKDPWVDIPTKRIQCS